MLEFEIGPTEMFEGMLTPTGFMVKLLCGISFGLEVHWPKDR